MKDNLKKLLIVGASILQLPAIIKAKQLGYYVAVADYNPKAVGITYADKFFNVSTIDIEGITRIALEFQPNGILTLATDAPIRAVAQACEACGLPGISYDTAIIATDKAKMKAVFEEHGIESPWHHVVHDKESFYKLADELFFPCIMKPTDSSGSRGVVLCRNKQELFSNYEYSLNASQNGKIIIEEYLDGPEFSIEVMVVDHKPHVLQITDKITTGAPHFVEMGHSQPTVQPMEVQKKLIDLAVRAVESMGINNGPAHVEMILTDNGPKMVELGARMGGDFITTHLVPLSTGVDMMKATIDIACGQKADIEPKFRKGSAIKFFDSKVGSIKSIHGVEKATNVPGVVDIIFFKKIGENISEIISSNDRIGFVISQAESAIDAVAVCDEAKNQIIIEFCG